MQDNKIVSPSQIVIKSLEYLEHQNKNPDTSNNRQVDVIDIELHDFKDVDTLLSLLSQFDEKNYRPNKFRLILQAQNFGNDEIVLNILKRVKQICENVTELGIGFESWGYDNPDITNTSTQYIVELLSQFTELNSLEISIFENGLENKNFGGDSVILLMNQIEKLKKDKMKNLKLNLGRIGCNQYSSLAIMNKHHISSICNNLKEFTQLEVLDLNLRSWGYYNPEIGDDQVKQICDSISNCTKLTQLSLNFYMWGYQNRKITSFSIHHLVSMLCKLTDLEDLNLILRRFEYIKWSDILYLGFALSTLKNLKSFLLNIELWKYYLERQNEKPRNESLGKLAYILGYRHFLSPQNLNLYHKLKHGIEFNGTRFKHQEYFKAGRDQKMKMVVPIKAVKENYKTKFRKEILWEIMENCFTFIEEKQQFTKKCDDYFKLENDHLDQEQADEWLDEDDDEDIMDSEEELDFYLEEGIDDSEFDSEEDDDFIESEEFMEQEIY